MQAHDNIARSVLDFTPLMALFGNNLTLVREGRCAHWSLDGRSALVEMCEGGSVAATFLERATIDGVSAKPVAAMYRGSSVGYRLEAGGASRMVSDMVAFFGGVREPRFTFVGIRASEAPSR